MAGRRPALASSSSSGLPNGRRLRPSRHLAARSSRNLATFAGPIPGIAADVIDDEGNPVRGSVGELAIRAPWPGMTRGFWRDPARYEETYWSKIPDVWVHGDWATVDDDGFWFIQGRSDDTIKIAGKRVGPAEVESAAVGHPAVAEAAAIGQASMRLKPAAGTAMSRLVSVALMSAGQANCANMPETTMARMGMPTKRAASAMMSRRVSQP